MHDISGIEQHKKNIKKILQECLQDKIHFIHLHPLKANKVD